MCLVMTCTIAQGHPRHSGRTSIVFKPATVLSSNNLTRSAIEIQCALIADINVELPHARYREDRGHLFRDLRSVDIMCWVM